MSAAEMVYDVPMRALISDAAWGAFAPKGPVRLLLDATLNLPKNWLGKRTFYALRSLGRFYLAGGPLDVTRLGARLRLIAEHNICEGRILFNPDYFDLRERMFLSESLPEAPIFIDGGANIGGYSFHVCNVRPQAQVISIEAQESTFKRLAFNAAQNPQMNITPVHCALGSEDGTVRFFISDVNSGESSIRVEGAGRASVEVRSLTLLTLAQDFGLPRIDAVKLDIEGAEDLVLQAFFETAPRHLFPGLILIENSKRWWSFDAIDFLKRHGYRPVREFGKNVVLERGPDA